MIRASTCPSSGGQIVLLQHLVSSLSVNGCTVCRMRADSAEMVNEISLSSCLSVCLLVCPHGTTRLPLDGFSLNFIPEYFAKIYREFKFNEDLTRITGTLHEDLCIFLVISRWIPLAMRNVSDKLCGENRNIRLLFGNVLFRKSCSLIDNVEKIVEPDRPQKKLQYCASALHAGYVTLQTHTQNI